MTKLVGLRVVRGPDWKWGDQDGGEGCAGTVVECGTLKGEHIAKGLEQRLRKYPFSAVEKGFRLYVDRRARCMRRAGIVDVIWDSGVQGNYRTGYNGAYDLRVLDNVLVGVKHPDVVCQGIKCEVGEILGIRWQCSECNANLCINCFLDIEKRHDPQHKTYKRYDNPEDPPYDVTTDSKKRKVELKGLFVGAKVRKGRDWIYGNQDAGQLGEIVTMKHSELGKVAVQWGSNEDTLSYRCGLDGKVELKAVEPSVGGSYQPEWLPVLKSKESSAEYQSSSRFAVGDRVKMVRTVGERIEKHELNGGWNPEMEKFIGIVGVVHYLYEDGYIEVKYEDYDQKCWCVYHEILQKVSQYYAGLKVRILNDEATMKDMNERLGSEMTDSIAGKMGRVVQADEDLVDANVFVDVLDSDDTIVKESIEMPLKWITYAPSPAAAARLEKLAKLKADSSVLLMDAVSEGDLSFGKEFFKNSLDIGHSSKEGMTALHLASFNGSATEFAKLLLDHGADVNKEDNKGRRALYFAVKGCEKEVLELLMDRHPDLDAVTTTFLRTALQKAVEKQFTRGIQLLILKGCDVNKQDSYGDTPLHNAVYASSTKIAAALIESGRIDLTIRNKRGLNVLHTAVVADNFQMADTFLKNGQASLAFESVGNTQTTALHIACSKGFYQMASLLVYHLRKQTGRVENSMDDELGLLHRQINAKDENGQTPLLLVCSTSCNYAIIELLVKAGANVNETDENGNTAIISIAKNLKNYNKSVLNKEEKSSVTYRIYCRYNGREHEETMVKYPCLAAICFLVTRKGNFEVKNKDGKTAADFLGDTLVRFLRDFESDPRVPATAPRTEIPDRTALRCILCSEQGAIEYRFKPCGHATNLACLKCTVFMQSCSVCRVAQTDNIKKLGEMKQSLLAAAGGGHSSEIFLNIGNEGWSTPDPAETTAPAVAREEKLWKIVRRGSRNGIDWLEDGLGGTYTRRHGSPCTWECSKKSGSAKKNCPVVVREINGSFHLSKGPHCCTKKL